MNHNTLLEVIELFRTSAIAQKNPRLISNLRTVLKFYVLPRYGFSEEVLSKQFDQCAAQIPIERFRDVMEDFNVSIQSATKSGKVSNRTLDNYKSVLKRFLQWMEQQAWYEAALPRLQNATPLMCARDGNAFYRAREGNRNPGADTYGIVWDDLPVKMQAQFEEYHEFLTALEVDGRSSPPCREITFTNYRKTAFYFFGWLKNIKGEDLNTVSLETFTDLPLLKRFVQWGINKKGNGYTSASKVTQAAISVSKWLDHSHHSKRNNSEIKELKEYHRYLCDRSQKEPSRQNEQQKLLSLPECIQVVEFLRQNCGVYYTKLVDGKRYKNIAHKRSDRAILLSWMRYLAVAILVYCPVRQQEIRHFQIGKTLFREVDKDGKPYYRAYFPPSMHKNGSKTGEPRDYKLSLPDQVVKDLDEWIEIWRPRAKYVMMENLNYGMSHGYITEDEASKIVDQTEEHKDFIFISMGKPSNHMEQFQAFGKPLSRQSVWSMVVTAVYRATHLLLGEGKRPNPHFFRNIAITWQRAHGNPAQNKAFAKLMGHSEAMADKVYNEMSELDWSKKADNWWDQPGDKS